MRISLASVFAHIHTEVSRIGLDIGQSAGTIFELISRRKTAFQFCRCGTQNRETFGASSEWNLFPFSCLFGARGIDSFRLRRGEIGGAIENKLVGKLLWFFKSRRLPLQAGVRTRGCHQCQPTKQDVRCLPHHWFPVNLGKFSICIVPSIVKVCTQLVERGWLIH